MNKSKSLIIFLCIASCSRYDFSATFSTSPANPKAGKTLTVLYNSDETILKDEEFRKDHGKHVYISFIFR